MSEEQTWESVNLNMESINLNQSNIDLEFEFDFDVPPFIPTVNIEEPEKIENVEAVKVKSNPEPRTNAEAAVVSKVDKKAEEAVISRCKVLKEAKDIKETVNVVFIGHVDAGKSTIGGHLLYLTGMVDKRTLEKYEKEAKEKNRESWYFSWALDTNSEERDKGITVEVGRAFFETTNKRFTLLDAPGHKGYIPNMIGGTAQADVAILVVSARKGEFETGFDKGGQTREHALIAKTFGVKHMVVVINKMDDPTVEWSEERYTNIETRMQAYLKIVGWKPSELYFMPISGYSGANLKVPVSPSVCSWWTNKPTFLQYLDDLPKMNQDLEGIPMVIVSDKFKDMGAIVIGRVVSGCFSKNDTFVIMPIQKTVKVANILSMDEEEKQIAKIGDNIKIRLTGIEEEEILPGFVMCHPTNICPVGATLEAQLVILDCKSIICPGFKAMLHVHNTVDEVVFGNIKRVWDKKTNGWSKTIQHFVKQDSICVVNLTLSNPHCIAPFSSIPYLGRFTIRDESKTVAVGKILKVKEL